MTKREQAKQIFQTLLDSGKLGKFTRMDIDKAIMKALFVRDARSLNNWFNLLWRLEYFTQPAPGVYDLNFEALVLLEVPLPLQVDPKQRRLTNSL